MRHSYIVSTKYKIYNYPLCVTVTLYQPYTRSIIILCASLLHCINFIRLTPWTSSFFLLNLQLPINVIIQQFYPRTILDWNLLLESTISTNSVMAFKGKLNAGTQVPTAHSDWVWLHQRLFSIRRFCWLSNQQCCQQMGARGPPATQNYLGLPINDDW